MFCKRCGSPGSEGAVFCSKCGAQLGGARAAAIDLSSRPMASGTVAKHKPAPSVAPDFDEEALGAFIGPGKRDWYLKRFAQRSRDGASLGWHWPALFVALYWLIYRRMWLYCLLYILMPFPVGFALGFVGTMVGLKMSLIQVLIVAVIWITPPLLATNLYWWHAQKQVRKVKARTEDRYEQLAMLSNRGGTRAWVMWLVLVVTGVGLLAAVMIPAYHDYTLRSKARQAYAVGRVAAFQVNAYYETNRQMPASLQEAGFVNSVPIPVVTGLSLGPRGVIEVNMKLAERVRGRLLFEPQLRAGSTVLEWTCRPVQLELRHVPKECREGVVIH